MHYQHCSFQPNSLQNNLTLGMVAGASLINNTTSANPYRSWCAAALMICLIALKNEKDALKNLSISMYIYQREKKKREKRSLCYLHCSFQRVRVGHLIDLLMNLSFRRCELKVNSMCFQVVRGVKIYTFRVPAWLLNKCILGVYLTHVR